MALLPSRTLSISMPRCKIYPYRVLMQHIQVCVGPYFHIPSPSPPLPGIKNIICITLSCTIISKTLPFPIHLPIVFLFVFLSRLVSLTHFFCCTLFPDSYAPRFVSRQKGVRMNRLHPILFPLFLCSDVVHSTYFSLCQRHSPLT